MDANVSTDASWGEQVEAALPIGATGEHLNEHQRSPPSSYAAAAATHTRPAKARQQEDIQTEFEKQIFHPLNVTPDRLCSVYFNLADNSETTKEIFNGLIGDEIPADSVRCLERNLLDSSKLLSLPPIIATPSSENHPSVVRYKGF